MTYTPIATIIPTGSTATVTFSSIPASFRDLFLVATVRTTFGAMVPFLRFNGSTVNYFYVSTAGNYTTTASSQNALNFAEQRFADFTNPGVYRCNIMDYAQTNKHKTVISRTDCAHPSFTSYQPAISAGRWEATSAINSITFGSFSSSQFLTTDSVLTLYGIAG
jgi:hypothetical protein